MRTLRSLLVLSTVLFFALSSPVFADDLAIASRIDTETADVVEISEDAALGAIPAAVPDLGPIAGFLGTAWWANPKPMASFGSHCSGPPSPWSCNITESGLGCPPGGGCTYSCQCDRCIMSDGRVETVAINCTLVDDGGCLACPM